MKAGWLNIAIGVGCIIGGASGTVVLIGTDSSSALVVAGLVGVGFGAWQLYRDRAR